MGLDDEFATVRLSLLANDTLPSVNVIYRTLTREDAQLATSKNWDARLDGAAFAAQGQRSGSRPRDQSHRDQRSEGRATGQTMASSVMS